MKEERVEGMILFDRQQVQFFNGVNPNKPSQSDQMSGEEDDIESVMVVRIYGRSPLSATIH
jgi:hypothetical protein